ncbi:DeoR/GlpR family DNA-binding transcription regulator [Dubosiella muris]|uniref:DeoR/GlpR transcriptional regulator n=1 Tax=Dubosiella muris TaxID=3038133 RepID=A0AC61RBU6_9FIRM|nr:DeoR/GlpR family DNA-binding transcription regulator [Dubosiella muris]TGY67288.1 DeoR/GlpR transcriptional regulator [Dubosiella muris]
MSQKREERHHHLREILLRQGRTKIKDLAQQLSVTPETLRADLNVMEKAGLVIKEHGFARLKMGMVESPVAMRNQENQDEKRRAMSFALTLVHDGDVVFIDSGSTTLPGLPALVGKKDLIVVTNSLLIANECVKLDLKIVMIGGFVFNNGMRTYGNFATELIDHLQIDIAFLGTDGFKDSLGFTTCNENEMGLKRHLINRSKKLVVVCDESKFETKAPFSFCRFSEIDVLVTNKLSPEQRKTVGAVPTVYEID